MFAKGEQWDLYDGASVGRDNIKWTSYDESVCTVSRGIVTAVGPGDTTVVAEYNGQTLKCIVRVRIEEDESTATDPSSSSTTKSTNATTKATDGTTKGTEETKKSS